MNTLMLQQGSAEWLYARLGRCTGSRVKDALQVLKNGDTGAARRRYLVDVVGERLTGLSAGHFLSDAMAWGSEQEQYARAAYEVQTGQMVDLVGMAIHPKIEKFSASPDGYIGPDGILEIKCPMTATHLQWMDAGKVPTEHEWQCFAEMACCQRTWVDFVSFDPRLSSRYQMFIKRLHWDDVRIAEMEVGVLQFLADVDAMIARLDALNPELQNALAPAVEDGITDEDIPEWFRTMEAA